MFGFDGSCTCNTYPCEHSIYISDLYFEGSKSQYESLIAGTTGNGSIATLHYYSATEPTEEGNFWYYDADGNIVDW